MKSLSEVENGFAGVLFLIDEIQLEFNSLESKQIDPSVMEINGVSYDVWSDTAYNLSDIDDKFGGLVSVVRFASALLVYLALIRYLINTYHRIFGEGE